MGVEITDAAALLILDWLTVTGSPTRPAGCYLALGTGSSSTGLTGELSGSGYARQSVTCSTAASRATANTNTITFGPATASWGSVTHFGIYSASTGGTCIFAGSLTTSKTVGSGDSLVVAAGDLDLTVAAYSD